ncbi:phage coat protein [Vibrio hannami]|uniref:phage coat protein n=1 Tax=Vibrio hannami TaxID=2717094 RepID=UPI0024101DC1|nr:phage coat protein [Vibrio hannami]MDG3085469.1 phage coat protein [Vibrio hannami]
MKQSIRKVVISSLVLVTGVANASTTAATVDTSSLFNAIDLSGIATNVIGIGVVAIGIAVALKAISLAKRAVNKA